MKKIGIIGFGNMGEALAIQLKSLYKIIVFDCDKHKLKDISGIKVAKNNIDLVKAVDILILAVKPQECDNVFGEIKDYIKDRLIISIAAGITTTYIERHLRQARVIRAMPNLPLKVGKGMICLCRGETATENDLRASQQLFKNLGETLSLREDRINAATAISGSGPGYLYDWARGKTMEEIKEYTENTFIPSLKSSAEVIGFSHREAKILAEATGRGSISYLEETKLSPQEARQQVSSKGGTTQAGLEVLHKGGSLEEAVRAALKRADELCKPHLVGG